MNRKIFTAGLGTTAAVAVMAISASATVIGTPVQGSTQGLNATQLANSSTATGNIINLDPTHAPAAGTQMVTGALDNEQAVGSAGGTNTLIAPTGPGPSQSNRQGANIAQGSENGAIGSQIILNAQGNSQIIGGDQTCVAPMGGLACGASTIIASPSQGNAQGTNASQLADGGVTTGNIIVAPDFTFNAPAGTVNQTLNNPLTSSQIVLG